MKFGIVDPSPGRQFYQVIDLPGFIEALRAARLTPGTIDHGTLSKPNDRRAGIGIAVFELGMFVPPASQSYFAIERRLYCGSATLYGFDKDGRTVDVPELEPSEILWLRDANAAEAMITAGLVDRPVIGSGRDIIWRWPEPRPSQTERDGLLERVMAHPGTLVIDGDTTIMAFKGEKKK